MNLNNLYAVVNVADLDKVIGFQGPSHLEATNRIVYAVDMLPSAPHFISEICRKDPSVWIKR